MSAGTIYFDDAAWRNGRDLGPVTLWLGKGWRAAWMVCQALHTVVRGWSSAETKPAQVQSATHLLEAGLIGTDRMTFDGRCAFVSADASRREQTTGIKPSSRTAKKERAVALLASPSGTTIEEITRCTGWQASSTRAALSEMRRHGLAIERVRCPRGRTFLYRAVITSLVAE